MPVVGQTPCTIIKAGGGTVVFSPECVVALANIGLQPEDFGTYSQVRARQSAARAKVKGVGASGGSGGSSIDGKPTKHDRFLANCQAGHLTQNATQQRKRGNACTNATDGYSDAEAPCAPHYGNANKPGTEHYLVTRLECKDKPTSTAAVECDADDKKSYRPEDRAKADAERGQKVQNAIGGNKQDFPKNLASANGDGKQKGAGKTFKNMQKARAKSAEVVKNEQGFKDARAQVSPADLDTINKETNGETAAACIEAFRQAGMRAMKEKAASQDAIDAAKKDEAEGNKTSKDPTKTNKQMAEDDAKAAKKREDEAKQDKKDLKKKHDDDKAQLQDERTKAREKEQAAQREKREQLKQDHKDENAALTAEHKKKIDAAHPEKKAALREERAKAREDNEKRQKGEIADQRAEHKEESDTRRAADAEKQSTLQDKHKSQRAASDEKVANARDERESTQAKADRYADAKCRVEQGERLQKEGLGAGGGDGLVGGYGNRPSKAGSVPTGTPAAPPEPEEE